MNISGKCPPNATELKQAATSGFENVELYLTKAHLDNFQHTVSVCTAADVNITSVHTPHVWRHEHEYFRLSNELADHFDAVLVVHSSAVGLIDLHAVTDNVEFTVPHGFENGNGDSDLYIRNHVFEQERQFILDTAHLYTGVGHEEFYTVFENLISTYGDSIPLIHLCDATELREGLPFGEGEINLDRIISYLDRNYGGIVVLEVMPEYQGDALRQLNRVLNDDH